MFVFVLWRLDLVAIRGTVGEDALYTQHILFIDHMSWFHFKIQDSIQVPHSHIIADYSVHGFTLCMLNCADFGF